MFRLALRQTEGLIGSIIDLLGLSLAVPTFSTLCRRAETVQVPRPRAGNGADTDADSEKHGAKRRRSWRKLHIGVDAGTGAIVAATLTTKDVDDASEVALLLEQVEDPLASFTADGA